MRRISAACAALALLGAVYAAEPALAQNEQAAQTQLMINQLGDQIRSLTGQLETQDHQIQVLNQQLEKMRADTELRFNEIEGKGAGSAAPELASAPSAGPAGAPPRSLGTIPAGSVPATPAGAPAGGGAQQEYKAAVDMVGEGNYGSAEKSFRAFIAAHPKDALAPSAAYYVGEALYMRGKYQDAAVAFADAYQKFPKGPKAPDTLLDLGRSLDKLGKSAEACASYAQLTAKFPSAPPAIKKQVAQEKTHLKCG